MNCYPDTSYVCALYRQQYNTAQAIAFRAGMTEPLQVSALLEFEFQQSMRLQSWLSLNDKSKGCSHVEASRVIRAWQAAVTTGQIEIVPCDHEAVLRLAQALSVQHTALGGHRTLDVLHVATALHFQAQQFLTFDARQKNLAVACGLVTPL